MEQFSKDGKCGTIQSFFNLQLVKKQKADNSSISTEMIVFQSDIMVSPFTTSE
jgi:hypothetical protein